MNNKTLIALIAVFACSLSYAEEKKAPTPKQAAQTAKMKACNAEAKEKQLKGDARKTFMSTCLKTKTS
ncbi:MAG TPA: PsiF family protein [Burkholderiales bacterium]|nr:PsiF family protein [Burkholderiales bacterium]